MKKQEVYDVYLQSDDKEYFFHDGSLVNLCFFYGNYPYSPLLTKEGVRGRLFIVLMGVQ